MTNDRKTASISSVAVVCGGLSPEAESSRQSAASLVDALTGLVQNIEIVEFRRTLPADLISTGAQVVVPVTHGVPGEDGTVQGLLECMGLPYVGSGVLASALAIRKDFAKVVLADVGISVPEGVLLESRDDHSRWRQAIDPAARVHLVIKPVDGGSGFGVARVRSMAAADTAIERCLEGHGTALVEQSVDGIELTVGVLDTGGRTGALVPVVVSTSGTDPIPPISQRAGVSPLEPDHPLLDPAVRVALDAHRALDCRHLSRVDLIVRPDGELVVLEVNTMPGLTPDGAWVKSLRAAGLELGPTFEQLLRSAASDI